MTISNLLFCEDDNSKQLVLKSFHRHCEVDDGRFRADFRCVRRIAEFRGDVQLESVHDVNFFVADFHLVRTAGLDKVSLKNVVKSRIEFLADVFN